MTSRTLGHRAPLLWVLLPLMAGLVAGKLDWLPFPPLVWALAAVGCIVAAFASPRAWTAGIVTGVFLSGAAYYDLSRDRLDDWDSLPPREVNVTLQIDRVFPPEPGWTTVGGLGRIVASEAHVRELERQRVYFSIRLKPDDATPVRSSRMEVTGVLQTLPRNAPDDSFDGYLSNQGMNFTLTRARVTGMTEKAGAYPVFCDTALRRFNEILTKGIGSHPEQGGVLRAMLLGRQQELSDGQKTVFRESGTMHLFSISGLHIAVIAVVIQGILLLARLPALVRVAAGGVLLWLYVDITGGTPSAVRAFLMVMFLHASHTLRVPGNPFAALVASAVCVLLVEPMQLFTASFQLSYGIVTALLLLGLPMAERLLAQSALFTQLPKVSWRWWHHTADWVRQAVLGSLAIGLATSVVSLVSGVVIFGLFTPVSLIANLVLIPVGSLVIISGFLALLSGLAGAEWLAVVLNHANVLLLIIVEKGVHLFVDLPGASHAARFSPVWLGQVAFAGLLGVILAGYTMNWSAKRGGMWTPFIFALLALLAGMRWVSAPP